MSLYELARRLYLRATTYPAKNPELCTDTATCAAQCAQPIALGEPHYTVVRQAEQRLANGEIQPLDGDDLAYLHLDCWPAEYAGVVIAATVDAPGESTVRSEVAS